MKKNDFITLVSERADMSKKDAEQAVNAVIDSIEEALMKGEKIQFTGFGTFEVKVRPERTGRNPKTSEPMVIPECRVPSFKAGKNLKDKLN